MEIRTTNPQKENAISKLMNSYRFRQCILLGMDICCVLVTFLLSLRLTVNENNLLLNSILLPIAVCMIFHAIVFMKCGCYSSLWRYAGAEELISIVVASISYAIPCMIVHRLIGYNYPILFYIVNVILVIALTGGVRLSYRTGRRLTK